MNPDYYKTKYGMMYKHELDRVKEMDDYQLETRYGKMTKQDKIGAFYEALTDEDRAKSLRKKMEGNHGIAGAKRATHSTKMRIPNPPMKFIKVLNNDDDNNGNVDKKALFYFSDGNYYLYSFVCNNLDGACTVNETMTFLSNSEGEILDADEIYNASGYVHSTDAMNYTIGVLETI